MLLYVLGALDAVAIDRVVVVVGHAAERITKKLQDEAPELVIDFVEQAVQRGTGDAVSVGLTAFDDDMEGSDSDVVVLPGDTPLLRPGTIARLVDEHQRGDAACTILSAELDDPTGYGRVLHERDGRVARVVEEGDATPAERELGEINTSIYCFRRSLLAPALRRLSPENSQGEYYLTDVVGVLHDAGYRVDAVAAADAAETQGVNDRRQLAVAEAELRRRTNDEWLRRGVTMVDPQHTYIDAGVDIATDVTLFPGTVLQGRTVIGARAEIGPNTRLADCVIGPGATVEATTGRDAEVGEEARVGPYAFLRPGSAIPPEVVTGPFYTAAGPDVGEET